LTDLAERISPRGEYDYDVASYDVDRRHAYPRFVCAQCHSHPRDRNWDEYRLECARFRLVIYDDPAYYPYRYDRGRAVAADRPLHPGPRFVFRNVAPDARYVTRLRGRPDEADRRRARELSPARPLVEQHRAEEPRPARRPEREVPRPERRRPSPTAPVPNGLTPAERDTDGQRPKARPSRRSGAEPQSTGGPELRRRKR
jgi:hypothetical protein